MKHFERIGQEQGLNMIQENPCTFLDFGKLVLAHGAKYEGKAGEQEIVMVLLAGRGSVHVGEQTYENIGGRSSVLGGKPHAVYIPPRTRFAVRASEEGGLEAALAFARATEPREPFVVSPSEVVSGKWGVSNFSRTYHQIVVRGLPGGKAPQRLIVGETYTPSGNWSTFPPHRHEHDDLPKETFMEEMYYFKVFPPDGWGLLKLYTDDGSIDEVHTIEDETIAKMPRGYHTVVSAPGYTTYYLWFLAGNTRIQATVADPCLGWVERTIPMIKNIEENLAC